MNTTEELAPFDRREIVVSDAESYRSASAYLIQLKTYRHRVEEYWEKDIKTAYHHHRSLVAKRDALLSLAAQEESNTKYALLTWRQAEERKRQAEQARLDALGWQAAADRALADAAALAEHGQESECPELVTMADSMIAGTYIDQEFAATRQVVQSTVPKVAGISTPTRLIVELADKKALVLAIAAGEMLALAGDNPALGAFLRGFHPVQDGLHYLEVLMPAVRREATNRGERFSLPGISSERRVDIR